MNLVSKMPESNYFWVEDFNNDDEEFFINLGFNLVKSKMPKEFGGKDTLNKDGSGVFGLWTNSEADVIIEAIIDKYGECVVFQDIPD